MHGFSGRTIARPTTSRQMALSRQYAQHHFQMMLHKGSSAIAVVFSIDQAFVHERRTYLCASALLRHVRQPSCHEHRVAPFVNRAHRGFLPEINGSCLTRNGPLAADKTSLLCGRWRRCTTLSVESPLRSRTKRHLFGELSPVREGYCGSKHKRLLFILLTITLDCT